MYLVWGGLVQATFIELSARLRAARLACQRISLSLGRSACVFSLVSIDKLDAYEEEKRTRENQVPLRHLT